MLPLTLDPAQLPDDIATLKAMVIAAEKKASDRGLEIEALKLTIAKLQRSRFGTSSESGKKLLDQLELQLAELEESVAEDKASHEMKAPPATATADEREDKQPRKPARRPLPAHLPRERLVHLAPPACPCCGGRLRKLGEDITETLEHVPAQWKVIQHVREKFSCRRCEAITQAPAPSHPIARGRAGPQLLAQVLFAKYRAHLPLNRQSDIYANEGVDLDTSTLAEAMDYSLKRWAALTRFLDDGRICLSNNAAERAVRGIAVGRRNWTFAGDRKSTRLNSSHSAKSRMPSSA